MLHYLCIRFQHAFQLAEHSCAVSYAVTEFFHVRAFVLISSGVLLGFLVLGQALSLIERTHNA